MKMPAIAYKDKDGLGFGLSPWIISDFNTLKEATEHAEQLKSQGYKDVKVFYTDEDWPGTEKEITWEYVNSHLA